MTTKELKTIGNDIIGKHVSFVWTGARITGVVTEIFEDECALGVFVKFDKQENWGGEWYTKDIICARKFDDFGSLKHLNIID